MLKKGSDSTEKMELPRVQRKLAANEVSCGLNRACDWLVSRRTSTVNCALHSQR